MCLFFSGLPWMTRPNAMTLEHMVMGRYLGINIACNTHGHSTEGNWRPSRDSFVNHRLAWLVMPSWHSYEWDASWQSGFPKECSKLTLSAILHDDDIYSSECALDGRLDTMVHTKSQWPITCLPGTQPPDSGTTDF